MRQGNLDTVWLYSLMGNESAPEYEKILVEQVGRLEGENQKVNC